MRASRPLQKVRDCPPCIRLLNEARIQAMSTTVPILYRYPIWITAVLLVGLLLFALETGYWLGCRWRRRTPKADRGGSGDIALTAMYGLLGLVLAFTYAYTIGHSDSRKQAVVEEANALGTAFLRAGLVQEPARSELRQLLRDYAATRVFTAETVGNQQARDATLTRSREALSRLWPATERMVQDQGGGPVEVVTFRAINDVIDMDTTRLFAAFDLLPETVLCMLLFVASAALAVSGYNRGLIGDMNRTRMTALTLVLATVMTVITDFDRGYRGLVRINQRPLEELIRDMDATLAGGGQATPAEAPASPSNP